MKTPFPLLCAATLSAALLGLTGCGKSDAPGAAGASGAAANDTKITGKPSDPPVQLKAVWKPGWKYDVFVQSQQTADLGFGRGRGGGGGGGNEGGVEATFKQDLSITATNGPKDGVSLDMELQSLGVTMFAGSDTVMHYDSAQQTASGQAEQVAGMLDTLVGGQFTCLLDSEGKLQEVGGIKELIEKATAATENAGGGAAARGGGRRGMGMGMMGGMMGAGMLQRMLSDTFFRPLVEFPGQLEGPARVGQSWTNQQELTVMMIANVTVLTTNTFVGWQMRDGHKCARIEVTGTIEQARRAAPQGGMDFMRMLGDLSIEDAQVSGTIWLDPKLEFPVEINFNQKFNVAGTLPTGMGGMGGMAGRRGGPNAAGGRPAVDPATVAAAAAAAGVPVPGERFSRPVAMSLVMKLRQATGP